jgi:hypothetical protein
MTTGIRYVYHRFFAGFLLILMIISGATAAGTTVSPGDYGQVRGDIGVIITEYPTPVAGTTAIPPVPPLSINSEPQGADISVDGQYVGTTPHWMYLKSGVHTITLQKEGYNDKVVTINYDRDRGGEVNEVLETPGFETFAALLSIGAVVLLMRKTR